VLAVAPDYCFQNVTISVMNTAGSGQQASKTSAVEDLAKILNL
jgi:hypothetical protein